MDWLHDLARRLVARNEHDTVELLAARASNDPDLLFQAADEARTYSTRPGHAARKREWSAIAEALDGAAVHALRVNPEPPPVLDDEFSFLDSRRWRR